MGKTVLFTGTSAMQKWSSDIVEKIKSQLAASPTTLENVFTSIDTDGSGKLSAVEFRNGIRKMGLGLTSREID
jgi:Ca2+-binding EF-hand superfamily protein